MLTATMQLLDRIRSLAVVVLVSCASLARGGWGDHGYGYDTTYLYQSDFVNGTYRITESGKYVLAEDIVFNPNPATETQDAYDSFFPRPEQLGDGPGQYPTAEFTLGFFAAITIETSDVELDLNQYTIEQSAEHALMQRFFAVIELANSPFIPGQGPHDFTSQLASATNTKIHNGRIGRSAHHGIHGNGNENIYIKDIDFDGFEVAAVALNGVHGLKVKNCDMRNRKDVPVFGTFSAVRFLQRFVDFLVDSGSTTTLSVLGNSLDAQAIQDDLRNSVNNVYADVVATGEIDQVAHPVEYGVFGNPHRVIDGNAYCFLVNPIGVAVNGFPSTTANGLSTDVRLEDLNCIDLEAVIREVVALKQNGGPVNDPVGALIQLLNKDADGNFLTISLGDSCDLDQASYSGNAIANAQMFVGKAVLAGDFNGQTELDPRRNGVTQAMLDWVEAGEMGNLGDLAAEEGWLCNGDSMFHVQKGVIGFKLDGTDGLRASRLHVKNAINLGLDGSDVCGDYTFSHPLAVIPFYNGAIIRGFSLAGTLDAFLYKSSAENIRSSNGDAIGVDVHTDSTDSAISRLEVERVRSDREDAIGVRFGEDTSSIELRRFKIRDISAPMGDTSTTLDEGTSNNIVFGSYSTSPSP